MTLTKDTLKPYASFTLYTCIDVQLNSFSKQLDKIASLVIDALEKKMKLDHRIKPWKEDKVHAQAFSFVETRQASWCTNKKTIDTYNHLVVILHYKKYLGIVISDSAARTLANNAIESSLAFQKISDSALENAFVNDVVLRTLWLRGAHRRNDRKADSKVLFGPRVQAALNPMDDRSFMSSSVRSEAIVPIAGEKQRVIGTTPESSYIWIGPTKSAVDLTSYFVEIIDHLKSSAAITKNALPILSKPFTSEPKIGEVLG